MFSKDNVVKMAPTIVFAAAVAYMIYFLYNETKKNKTEIESCKAFSVNLSSRMPQIVQTPPPPPLPVTATSAPPPAPPVSPEALSDEDADDDN